VFYSRRGSERWVSDKEEKKKVTDGRTHALPGVLVRNWKLLTEPAKSNTMRRGREDRRRLWTERHRSWGSRGDKRRRESSPISHNSDGNASKK
jgi:hypothetical protein